MYICKNCGKAFDKKYSIYSDGNFCCKKCSRSYSSNVKRDEINKKVSFLLLKRSKEKYNKNPKVCPICNSLIPYERRMRKTCSEKCSNKAKAIIPNHKNCGGYRKGSGKGHKGWYKGIYCDSTYELAYVIYCLDHNIKINRCKETFEYIYKNKKHKYHPDFVVNDEIIEIKGIRTKLVDIKIKSVNKPIKILYRNDLIYCFNYVSETYNKIYKNGYNTFYELYDNYKPKYKYICDNCGKEFYKDKQVNTNIKFCCRSCSGKYIHNKNKNDTYVKNKISISLKKYYNKKNKK